MIHSGSRCIVQWFRRIADDGISELFVNRQTVDHGNDIELTARTTMNAATTVTRRVCFVKPSLTRSMV